MTRQCDTAQRKTRSLQKKGKRNNWEKVRQGDTGKDRTNATHTMCVTQGQRLTVAKD